MSHRTLLAALGLTAAMTTVSAQAFLIDFASNSGDALWAVNGSAGGPSTFTITDTPGTADRFDLFFRDDGQTLPRRSIPTELRYSFTATPRTPVNLGGSFLYIYDVTGTFSFFDAATGTNLLLQCTFGGGQSPASLVTVAGPAGQWGSSGNISGSDSTSTVTYTTTNALLTELANAGVNTSAYGIFAGTSGVIDDFGFTMTDINAAGTPVTLNAGNAPSAAWRAESSFSGTVRGIIPSPGGAVLLSTTGLVIGCRRRR